MNFVKTMAKALTWGIGIGVGVALTVFVAEQLTGPSSPYSPLTPEQLSQLDIRSIDIATKDGRIVISGRVANALGQTVLLNRVSAVVRERGKPIDSARDSFPAFCSSRLGKRSS